MSRFAFRLPLSVMTERGPGGEVNARSLIGFTISRSRLWGMGITHCLHPSTLVGEGVRGLYAPALPLARPRDSIR